jgi:hypothetical protein
MRCQLFTRWRNRLPMQIRSTALETDQPFANRDFRKDAKYDLRILPFRSPLIPGCPILHRTLTRAVV